jgi:hypothetical protein
MSFDVANLGSPIGRKGTQITVGGSRKQRLDMQRDSTQGDDHQAGVAALRTAFEMVSDDFGVTENDLSLRIMVAEVVVECAHEGLSEVMDIRKRANFILRSRSN